MSAGYYMLTMVYQGFDGIRVFYDGGQHAASQAIHKAFDRTFSRGAVSHEKPSYRHKRLCQVADYIAAIGLAAGCYSAGDVPPTYNKFYGDWKSFRANYLKLVRHNRAIKFADESTNC